ncbi:MAG TPA: hypothetical protein PKN96_11215, partial [Flavobacterium sp.]|uniref:hypothetical protein n=1 Tax=Flavobacterium sp. TaxID=239 RepID=UPI002B5625F6
LLVVGCWLLVVGCWLLVVKINLLLSYIKIELLKFINIQTVSYLAPMGAGYRVARTAGLNMLR